MLPAKAEHSTWRECYDLNFMSYLLVNVLFRYHLLLSNYINNMLIDGELNQLIALKQPQFKTKFINAFWKIYIKKKKISCTSMETQMNPDFDHPTPTKNIQIVLSNVIKLQFEKGLSPSVHLPLPPLQSLIWLDYSWAIDQDAEHTHTCMHPPVSGSHKLNRGAFIML